MGESELKPNECVVCGPVENTVHRVSEAMFATGESFDYAECGRCGSMQIVDPPHDLAPYYSHDAYYSFGVNTRPLMRRAPLRQALRANTALFNRTGVGVGEWWAREAGIRTSDRILDLGCGGGRRLMKLRILGYRHLAGADPFLAEGMTLPGEVPLSRADHSQIAGQYDWVTMHHAFEHVPDPRSVLRSVQRVLAPGGGMIVRMPVMGAAAWRTYGTAWAHLDAPRHFVVFTLDGFTTLARQEGFVVEKIVCDSNAFQFWGSELAARGLPHSKGPGGHFDRDQLSRWEQQAAERNRVLDGDAALYVLRVVNH